jgi:hypothetical protein
MTVLFHIDWDSGTAVSTTYTMATPEVPNAHTVTTNPSGVINQEMAAPWNGQWLCDTGAFWYSVAYAALSSATMQATSGRILAQFDPPTAQGQIWDMRYVANRLDGMINIGRNAGGNLIGSAVWNNDGSAASLDAGAMPTNPFNLEIIYDFNNATAGLRFRWRVWDVGASPGAFNDATTTSGPAGTSSQFDQVTLGDGQNNVMNTFVGKVYISDDITEELSALLGGSFSAAWAGGANSMIGMQ